MEIITRGAESLQLKPHFIAILLGKRENFLFPTGENRQIFTGTQNVGARAAILQWNLSSSVSKQNMYVKEAAKVQK